MPQNDKGQNKHRGSKNTLKNATASIDFEFLEMDSASKKLILEMGGEIRVPRSGRSITKNEGNSLKRLYHELDNHTRYDMSILHMKDYGLTDELPASIMDKLISKIGKAYTIQVLYIQNFPDGMLDAQLAHLTEVLKKGHIWAMNIGEAAKVSLQGWQKFAADLKYTNITHMYASENTLLTKQLKIKMMDAIRENRKTDKRHYDKSNRHIIDQVKKMWFNPSRSGKYQRQFKPPQGQEWSLSSPGAENNITNSNGKMNNNKACSIQEKKKCALIPGGSSKKKSASSSSSKKKRTINNKNYKYKRVPKNFKTLCNNNDHLYDKICTRWKSYGFEYSLLQGNNKKEEDNDRELRCFCASFPLEGMVCKESMLFNMIKSFELDAPSPRTSPTDSPASIPLSARLVIRKKKLIKKSPATVGKSKKFSSSTIKKKRKIVSSTPASVASSSSLNKKSRSEKKNERIQKFLRAKVADMNAKRSKQAKRKSRFELKVPASNLLSETEISKMTYRKQMAYITRQTAQEEVKKKGASLNKTFLYVHWGKEDNWRAGFIEDYNETTGKHKIKFDIGATGLEPVFLDVDLSTVETKSANQGEK